MKRLFDGVGVSKPEYRGFRGYASVMALLLALLAGGLLVIGSIAAGIAILVITVIYWKSSSFSLDTQAGAGSTTRWESF